MKFKETFDKFLEFFNKKQSLFLALGVIFVALFWRLYKISVIPQAVIAKEEFVLETLQRLINNKWIIQPENIPNAAYLYFMAGVHYITKGNILLLRITQGIIGTLSVGLFYVFVKNWFNRQTALLASLFMSTSAFLLIISRSLDPKLLIIPVMVGFLYLVTVALRTNKTIYFVFSGLVAGLSFYTDITFSFLPLIFVAAILYFRYKSPKGLKLYTKNIFIASSVALLALIPYLYFLPHFFPIFIKSNLTTLGIFYLNLGSVLQTLFYQSEIRSIYSIGLEPIIDPFVSISFISGFIYAVFYMRRKKFMILAAWFIFFTFIISLRTITNYTDFIFLLSPIFILSSIILDYVLTNWVRTFPFNRMARILMTFAFSLYIFLSIFYNYQKYFKAWNYNLHEKINLDYQDK